MTPSVHLTFKINVPKADFVNRETAIATAMLAMQTEVPRFIDWLIAQNLESA